MAENDLEISRRRTWHLRAFQAIRARPHTSQKNASDSNALYPDPRRQPTSVQCMWKNLPSQLIELLNRRGRISDLTCVSLGPKGEYFLKAKNGKAWLGGLSQDSLAKGRMPKLKQGHRCIKFMDFADDDTFLCRYN